MGYPTSVPSYTNKNAGDVIQPADVNDLQTEITAIETGLLNGLSHSFIANAGFTSSNSTMNALQVSSLSTFAYRPTMPPPEAAKVFLDSSVTLGSSGASTLNWPAQDYLTNSSVYSSVTNPSRLTPQTTGVFRFTAQLAFALNSTGNRRLFIRDSSGFTLGYNVMAANVSEATLIQACGLKRFDVLGSYAVCVSEMTGNSTLSLATGVANSWFAMEKL